MKLCLKSISLFSWCLLPSLCWGIPRLWWQAGLLPVPLLQTAACEGLRWRRKRGSKIIAPGSETSLVGTSLVVPGSSSATGWPGQGLSQLTLSMPAWGAAAWPGQGSVLVSLQSWGSARPGLWLWCRYTLDKKWAVFLSHKWGSQKSCWELVVKELFNCRVASQPMKQF